MGLGAAVSGGADAGAYPVTVSFDVDAAFMQLERHEWGIHVISLVTRGMVASARESLLSHRSLA
jgi:hypothetical protein